MQAYVQLTGTIFALVMLAHALRLVLHWEIEIAGWQVPMWISWLAVPVTGALCLWAFRLAASTHR